MVDNVGYYCGNDVRDYLRPHDAVEGENRVHYEQQRDIYHSLTQRGEDQRLLAHSHCLEGEAYLHVEDHKRNRKTKDAKEVGSHRNGIRITEKIDDLGRKELEQDNTEARKAHSRNSRAA